MPAANLAISQLKTFSFKHLQFDKETSCSFKWSPQKDSFQLFVDNCCCQCCFWERNKKKQLAKVFLRMLPDVNAFPEIQPLGTLPQVAKPQNLFGFLSDVYYKPEDVQMEDLEKKLQNSDEDKQKELK